MSFFGAIGHFFAKVGKKLGGVLVHVGKSITEAQFDQAIGFARAAIDKFTDNANRRTWVLHMLMTELHLSESMARIALEFAVQHLKEGEDKLTEKLDEILTPPAQVIDSSTNPPTDQPPADPPADPPSAPEPQPNQAPVL